uniref:Rab GTPase n=1 Tax=Rhabditophanes sp. KR3021 TaxID=114890 RepID=A0AC35TSU3_9BILA
MGADLQKRFKNGVNYNMKIVIRGDRNVGKTSLFQRLQGHPFTSTYTSTDQIQVTHIEWNYKNRDHIVKVDVWDVIDEGKKRKVLYDKGSNTTLKLANNSNEDIGVEDVACDASVVNVYNNAHGVIFVFDVTKAWSWQYVQRQVGAVPGTVPILIMANKRDLEKERMVEDEVVESWIREVSVKNDIRFTSASMKTSHGLKYLHTYFNVPFLHLQRIELEKGLKQNRDEMALAYKELTTFYSGGDVDEANEAANEQPHEVMPPEEVSAKSTPELSHQKDNSSNEMSLKESSDEEGKGGNKMVDLFEEDFDSADSFENNTKVNKEVVGRVVVKKAIDFEDWIGSSTVEGVTNNASLTEDTDEDDLGVGVKVMPRESTSTESESETQHNSSKMKPYDNKTIKTTTISLNIVDEKKKKKKKKRNGRDRLEVAMSSKQSGLLWEGDDDKEKEKDYCPL